MAVHTSLSRSDIENITSNYNIGNLIFFQGIKEGIENTNYLLSTSSDKYILTIYEERVKNKLLPFYLKIMINSHKRGIKCPLPVQDNNNNVLNKFKKKYYGIFTFIPGVSAKKLDEKQCFAIGKELAKFHIVNKGVHKLHENDFSLSFWNDLYSECKSFINEIIPNSVSIVEEEINFLNHNWPKSLPKGIIHADLFPDNVLFNDQKKISGLIDFYFSCYDFLSYDIAILVNSWCFPSNNFKENLFLNIMYGYESLRKLEKEEKAKFNILLRGASLRFLLTRILDSKKKKKNQILEIKDPKDFFKRLLFHRNLEYEFF